jgi:hypothetical protein
MQGFAGAANTGEEVKIYYIWNLASPFSAIDEAWKDTEGAQPRGGGMLWRIATTKL